VGIIADSGREAGRILSDRIWSRSPYLLNLPPDPGTLSAFAGWRPPEMDDDVSEADREAMLEREALAEAIHEEFRRERLADPPAGEPALEEWNSLHPDLQASNRDQALHFEVKLKAIGYAIADAGDVSEPTPEFTEGEVDTMARLEHGRWVIERLSNGWRQGEERSTEKKTSPYLVGWSDLPENIREYDRQTVRKIPEFLRNVNKVAVRAP